VDKARVSAHLAPKLSIKWSEGESLLLRASRQKLAAGKSRIERAFECRRDCWRALAKPDGREIDLFDNEHAVHMLYIERGKVLGYQRMLPTTRPYLLSEVMPELCEGEHPVGAHTKLIIETSPTGLLRMVQLHFRLMQLGLPRTMEGQDIIAIIISFDSRTLARLYETRSTKKTVTVDNTAHGPALLHA